MVDSTNGSIWNKMVTQIMWVMSDREWEFCSQIVTDQCGKCIPQHYHQYGKEEKVCLLSQCHQRKSQWGYFGTVLLYDYYVDLVFFILILCSGLFLFHWEGYMVIFSLVFVLFIYTFSEKVVPFGQTVPWWQMRDKLILKAWHVWWNLLSGNGLISHLRFR